MALQFRDNSTFKNFKDILNYYKQLFEDVLNTSDMTNNSNHGANPYLPDKWELPTSSEDTTVQYVYNPGYNYLKGLINTVEATKNGIHKGLRTLFINYDDPEEFWQEDLNYNLINAYAEGSRSFQYYNKKTQEFEERPEYFWTRGNYYDMLPMATAGRYLLAYKSSVENACSILEQYKTLFYKYSCVYSISNGESDGIILTYDMANSTYAVSSGENSYYGYANPYGPNRNSWGHSGVGSRSIYFYTSFWNEYLAELKNKVENSGSKNVKAMLKIGQKTQYPEQNNDSNVVYIKKYYGNTLWSDLSTGNNGKTVKSQKVTNTQTMSNKCGEYKSNIKVK